MTQKLTHSTLSSAVEDIRKLARSMKGISALGDALEGVASVEQAVNESKARLEAAHAAEEQAKQALIVANGQVIVAQSKAQEVLASAKTEAGKVVAQADETAAKLVHEAKENAAKLTQIAKTNYALAEAGLEGIRKEHAEVAKSLEEKSAQLANVKAELSAIRSKVGA